MEEDGRAFVEHLNELEIRCANGNFKNFELCSELVSRNVDKFPAAFEIVLKSIILHDYDRVLNLNMSDLGLRLVDVGDDQRSPCVFFEEDISDDPLLLYMRQLLLLFVGVSAIQTFMRANACGPPVSLEDFALCTSVLGDTICETLLSENGEWLSENLTHKEVLALGRVFLWAGAQIEGGSLTCGLWRIRFISVHQRLLPDRIPRMHDEVVELVRVTSDMKWMNEGTNSLSKLLFCVEAAQLHLHYHEVSAARQFIESARNLVGINIDLGGAYGKRTHFQQKAVAQLVVRFSRSEFLNGGLPTGDCHMPKDLQLGDDTILNKVSFTDHEANDVGDLQPEEQVVLLGYCLLARRSEAADPLLQEEIMSYVSCLLEQPKIWSIYVTTLVLRCKLEKESSRRVERAIMQLESVIDTLRGGEPPFQNRALMIYAAAFPMAWTLEKELADVQLSIGATKSALALYEKLRLWQEVVACLQLLGRTSQAEGVVREQLQCQETPLLWCLLGDILDDPEMYLKADELSGGKNARCQRSLGYHYYKKRDWSKCVVHFSRSLEINHLQPGVWFSLGYTAIQVEDYGLAAKAYRQVVVLDPDNFEAWNNLSNAYIRTKQKERAWRALQEALKCNYEEWRVWENYLVVSVDIGAFEEVIRAWHRLMDIKGKYVDSQVLGILVKAINEDIPDMSGQPASRLRRKALQLLGRVSSVVPNDCYVWDSYASLQCPDVNMSTDVDSVEKALLYQQKAVRFCNQHRPGDFAFHKRVLEVAVRSVELTLALIRLLEEGDARRARYKAPTRLSAQSIATKVKSALGDFSDEELYKLREKLDLLERSLGELQSM